MRRGLWRHALALALGLLLAFAISAMTAIAPMWLAPPLMVLTALGLGLRGAWLVLHAAFVPLLLAAVALDLPPWAWLAALALSYALCRHAIVERVPLFLSSQAAVAALAECLPHGARLVDLGCGTGSVVFPLARLRPDLDITGIESAWLPWLICRLRRVGSPVRLIYGNIWQQDWSRYDALYCYLSPAPMARVAAQFRRQAAPGARLISNTFGIENRPPEATVKLHDAMDSELLIWTQPE